MAQLKPVNSGVYKWADHPVARGDDRESRKILEGTSTHLDYLEIHATTQFPGAKPSTAHASDDIEECIIVKDGIMKAIRNILIVKKKKIIKLTNYRTNLMHQLVNS